MRDILITVVILGLLPLILKKPRLGTYVWVWLAMMVPHRLAFGFARSLPFSQMVAVATLIGFLATRDRYRLPRSPVFWVYLSFFGWMTVTSFFALDDAEAIFQRWFEVLKIHLFIYLSLMLIRGRDQIERLIWVMTLSLGFYGLKGGIFTLLTGGGGRVWGPTGGVIAGNNALGVALVMLVPFIYYLIQRTAQRYARYGLILLMVATFLAILGTQSRGALLALVAMAVLLALRSKQRLMSMVAIGGVLALAMAFMPDTWTNRMNTIETYDGDSSAMSRVYTWTTLWNLALDRPFVGAGFNAAIPMVFMKYAPPGVGNFDFDGAIYVAHSIYFQALGEHGFPGLALFLLLGLVTWLRAGRLAKQALGDAGYATWVPMLMRMVQVSLGGFAVGGAFLSMVHYDFPYYLVAIVMLVEATMSERRANDAALPAATALPDVRPQKL